MRRPYMMYLAVAILSAFTQYEGMANEQPEFASGQVWSIKSEVPTTTKVIIGRMEQWNSSIAVQVSLIDVI